MIFEKAKTEVMMLGIISFAVFAYQQASAGLEESAWFTAFDLAHIILLFVAVAFIFQVRHVEDETNDTTASVRAEIASIFCNIFMNLNFAFIFAGYFSSALRDECRSSLLTLRQKIYIKYT